MKDITFDTRIVAANPHSDQTKSFVKDTMKQIKRTQTSPQKQGFVYWFQHLSKPAFALLAIVAITLVSGAVYAAVHFAPAFLQMLGKETNNRGAAEYSFAGFKECSTTPKAPERFEVKKDANLSDEEVQKIIQANCELKWLEDFPGKMWPTTGTNPEWKDGDTIYYTRLDMLGTNRAASDSHAVVDINGEATDFVAPEGEKIRAFQGGEEVSLSDIKAGDAVFTISRMSETYYDQSKFGWNKETNTVNLAPTQQPKVIGLVALFKLSLPLEYYMQKQQLVNEIPECTGNEGELCPNTPYLDVYPVVGGEGARNPYLQQVSDPEFREISGEVTELSDDSLKLKSRSGKIYSLSVGDAGFAVYNRDYSGNYTGMDAKLKVGSRVVVRYAQPKNADRTQISREQVQQVGLQLEALNIKNGNIKQY